jgi:Ca2+-binding EF-hand superfamily protein
MEEFDTNKDGKVTWEEFRLAMARLKEKVNGKSK